MQITIEEAYKEACRIIGEQTVTIAILTKQLQDKAE